MNLLTTMKIPLKPKRNNPCCFLHHTGIYQLLRVVCKALVPGNFFRPFFSVSMNSMLSLLLFTFLFTSVYLRDVFAFSPDEKSAIFMDDLLAATRVGHFFADNENRQFAGYFYGRQPEVRNGKITLNVSGITDKALTFTQASLKRIARAGFTHFVISSTDDAHQFYLRLSFDDKALITHDFSVPEEANCKIRMKLDESVLNFSQNLSGNIHISALNADELKGSFTISAETAGNKHVRIKGRFSFQDGLS